MAKHGENIYLRKDGRWEGKYIKGHSGGKPLYGYLSGKSYEEVLQKKREKVQELEKKCTYELRAPLLLSEVSDRWLDSRRGILKDTTLVKYGNILKNHILPQFGDRRVDELPGDEVRLWLEGLLLPDETGIKMSAKSVNGVASVIRLIFDHARTYYHIPAPELDIYIKQAKNQIEILSHNEQEKLEEYLIEHINPGNLGIMSSLYTGLRLGEVCALRWGSIRLADGLLDVHATMSRIKSTDPSQKKTKIVITPPKSDCSNRTIPIPQDLLALMDSMRKPDDSFLLTGTKTYMDPRTLQNRFKLAIEKCGIAYFTYHALRHTFATRCIELGFDVKALSEILGHANVSITMNRYVHPTIIMKKDYMDRLSITR